MKRIGIFFLIACALISAGCATRTHLARLLTPVPLGVVGNHSAKNNVKFLVFGDSGTGGDDQRKVASGMWQVCAEQPNGCDFALVLGDNIYERWFFEPGGVSGPGDKNFRKKFEEPYSRFQRFDFWLVPGNHDWEQEDSVQAEINHTRVSDRWRMPFNHYSIPGLPKWLHVYGLDTTVIKDADYDDKRPPSVGSKRAAQLKNAKAQLDAVKAALRDKTGWIFLFGHHPVYSTGNHGTKNGNRGVNPAIKSAIVDELICDAGIAIDVYFAGHEHHQEHLEGPSFPGCEAAFHQVVQGAGGRKLRNSRKKVNGVATQKILITEYGFALVSVSRTKLAVDFYGYDKQNKKQNKSWGKRYGFEKFRSPNCPR